MKKHELNFLAIDFETATPDKMACQLGIVVVKNGVMVEKREWLIQPEGNRYAQSNIDVHGITPEDTSHCKKFPEVWKEAEPYFNDTKIVVAHNAVFDKDVLFKNLDHYFLNYDTDSFAEFECTYQMSGKSLHDLCEECHIDTEGHHDALFDAECCARFYIAFKTGEKVEIHHENNTRRKPHYHEQIHGDVLIQDLSNADPDNPFYDKKLVITGEFEQSRNELAAFFKKMGADVNTTISRKTQVVVIGEDPGPKKIEKLQDLLEQGYEIEVYTKEQIEQLYRK